MQILEIIPFYKNFKRDTLSYFSTKDVSLGSIVTINIRGRNIKGLVLKTTSISEQKTEIKNNDFALKKIKAIQKNSIINQELINTAKEVSDYFATSAGAIINSVIPNFVFNDLEKIEKIKIIEKENNKENFVKFVIQESEQERYSSYRRLIREEFAKKNSVLFVCPTIEDTRFAYKKMSKGIEENTFVFHSSISNNELLKNWNKVIVNKKPVLIISTPTYSTIPREDLGSIIIERESSTNYRSLKAPYLDYRIFAEIYAKNKNIRFFLGDLVLRLETLVRLENQEFHEFTPLKYRTLTTAKTKMVDMSNKLSFDNEQFKIVSDELKEIIKTTFEENENTFIFTSRRGLSPTIICMDCGTTVNCNNCNAPMVLHGKNASDKHNFFLCHRCNEKRSAGELCKRCGSWRLKTLGIGSQLVKKEIERDFPKLKIFILDSDHVKTSKQANSVIEKFNINPGSILIGTEMALVYLKDEIDNIVIVSIDSMFSNPDFNINEKILNTISRAKSKATKNFLIQSRKAEERIFKYIISGNMAEFIRSELEDRKKYNYPPYSLLVKIIIKGTEKGVERELENLRKFLENYDLMEYPIIRESTKSKITKGILIRFDRREWPQKNLIEKLRLLPSYYKIVIDAENIF